MCGRCSPVSTRRPNFILTRSSVVIGVAGRTTRAITAATNEKQPSLSGHSGYESLKGGVVVVGSAANAASLRQAEKLAAAANATLHAVFAYDQSTTRSLTPKGGTATLRGCAGRLHGTRRPGEAVHGSWSPVAGTHRTGQTRARKCTSGRQPWSTWIRACSFRRGS